MTDYPPPPGATPPPGSGGSFPPPPPPGGSSGGWGSAPPPPTGPGGFGYGPQVGRRPGELTDRFVARLIDHVLLGVVNAIVVTVIVVGTLFDTSGNGITGYGDSVTAAIIGSVLSTVIGLGYFVLLETRRGQTVGKGVMKLRVESVTGGNPTVEQSVKRNIWMALPLLGIVPVVGGVVGSVVELVAVIMIAVGISKRPDRRPWTDELGGTQVIKEG